MKVTVDLHYYPVLPAIERSQSNVRSHAFTTSVRISKEIIQTEKAWCWLILPLLALPRELNSSCFDISVKPAQFSTYLLCTLLSKYDATLVGGIEAATQPTHLTNVKSNFTTSMQFLKKTALLVKTHPFSCTLESRFFLLLQGICSIRYNLYLRSDLWDISSNFTNFKTK